MAPSILSADFAKLGEECAHVLGEGDADLLHLDVMDGHFVPNLTMGPALCSSIRAALPDAFLDIHLMVSDPVQYVGPFRDSGADHLTFHIEPVLDRHAGTGMSPLSNGYDPRTLSDTIRSTGMSAGMALNPDTDIAAVLPYLTEFDLILVMSVHPGFSGQAFIPEVLEKVRQIRSFAGSSLRVQVDGGIGPDTAEACRDAGADVLVAASAIFAEHRSRRAGVIRGIRGSTSLGNTH